MTKQYRCDGPNCTLVVDNDLPEQFGHMDMRGEFIVLSGWFTVRRHQTLHFCTDKCMADWADKQQEERECSTTT